MPKDAITGLFDQAEEHLLQKAVRRSEPTITDGLLAPAPESAPGAPPQKATVPRPRPRAPESEPPPAPESEAEFDPREAPTRQLPGRKRRRPVVEDSVYPPVVSGSARSEMDSVIFRQATRLSLGRTLLIIAAAGTAVSGMIAATGAAIVSIISALRPPSNIEFAKRLDAIETRVNGDFGLGLEVKTRQEKDGELQREIEAVKKAQQKLEGKLVVKVKPGRSSE